MANPVFDAVRTIMAIRDYQQKPIPADVVTRIVDAGRLTASASNQQEWHFVVVRQRETLERLADAVRTGRYVREAPLAVAVAVESGSPYAISDGSRAIQSMILTAWDAGVGSNWTGFGGLEGVRNKVRLPDRYEVLAVLPLGYPARPVKGSKKRKSLSEVASAERFGTPLA